MLSQPKERNDRAIATLIKGAPVTTFWGHISKQELTFLHDGSAAGFIAGEFGPDDYLRQVRTLHAHGVRTGPTFQLNVEDSDAD